MTVKEIAHYSKTANDALTRMNLSPCIWSQLMQDLYKFSMGQTIFHQFNSYITRWDFKLRNKDVTFTTDMVAEIIQQLRFFCEVRFDKEELDWLAETHPWIHRDYIDCFLRFFKPVASEIFVNGVSLDKWEDIPLSDFSQSGLSIHAEGPWLTTSMYEVPVLAIVNEVYFAYHFGGEGKMNFEFQERTEQHINDLISHKFTIGNFAEFGERRRYSAAMQDWAVGKLAYFKKEGKLPYFVGTSNVYLAKKFGLKAVGTMAHEFCMCVGQGDRMYNPAYSNKLMLDAWYREYGTWNGIALTDTIGTDVFLRDFRKTYCRVFDGVRHDSGDPVAWGNKMLEHYRKYGIDPHTKTLLFSDSLDFERADMLYKTFTPYANVSFGIGTFLSNPLDNPLNIVMKVTMCNGHDVAKLSDCDGKSLCKNDKYISDLRARIAERLSENN